MSCVQPRRSATFKSILARSLYKVISSCPPPSPSPPVQGSGRGGALAYGDGAYLSTLMQVNSSMTHL